MQKSTGPLIWVGFSMIVGFMGTALISPLYALYKSTWDLQVSEVTFLYVIYMCGALGAFAFFGRLADKVGFRKLMVIALAITLVGTLVSIAANGMFWLSVGRFLVGVGSSIVTPAGTVALTRLMPARGRQHLALINVMVLSFGFGLGPLIGGILGQWAPAPLVTTYLPTLALLLIAMAGLMLRVPALPLEGQPQGLKIIDFLPKLTVPEPDRALFFTVACGFPFLAFGAFGIYGSLSPLFIQKIMGWNGPIASGASITFILFASALLQILFRTMPTRNVALGGLFALTMSNLALMINLSASSALLFALSLALTALAHSMTMLAGMTLLHAVSTTANRAGLTSTYLVIAYTGAIVPLLGLGWIADRWGLATGVSSFCAAIILMSGALAMAYLHSSRRDARTLADRLATSA